MALINLRNALMSGKRLPYDSEVEFLESTGTQWIDTGYSFNSATDSVELTFELLSSTPRYKWIFGAYDTKQLAIGSGDATNMRRLAYNETSTYENDSFYFGGPHVFFANSTGVGIDGQKMIDFASFSTSSNILLYTIPLNAATYCSNSRIWSYKHYRNGVLVRDYISVRKDTVGYLYDRVSGKLFGNAGTGDFVLGQDVVPVEYIESHGTEYIDMGVAINTGTDTITSRFMPLTGINTYECLFGVSESISGVTTYCELRKLQNTRDWYMLYPNSVGGLGNTLIGTLTDSAWHDVSASSTGCIMDGVTTSYDVSTRQFTNNQYLFARNNNGSVAFRFKGRVASYSITRSGADIRAMKPIRVGSGSTWEGALLDTVNRRVYRNAGTGAFAYGNDV